MPALEPARIGVDAAETGEPAAELRVLVVPQRPQRVEVLVGDRAALGEGLLREKRVTLTSRGRAMVASALPLWEHAQRQITEGLGPARFDSLLTDLSKAVSLTHV